MSTPTLADLAALFGFTPAECALNRAGQFSERQRQTLFFRSLGYIVRGSALLALNLVLGAYLTTLTRRPVEWGLFGLYCLLNVGMILLIVRAIFRTVIRPQIHPITGTLHRSGDVQHPLILAGNTHLRVSFRRWKRLADTYPGHFTFYVGPGNTLLSLEPSQEDTNR